MRFRLIAASCVITIVAACASGPRAVVPGVNAVGQMQVVVGDGWLQLPASETPNARNTTRTYTRDGIEFDRLMLIPGVDDGESIFDNKSVPLPTFRNDMSIDEIGELTGSSLAAIGPAVGATITTSNPTPRGFGGHSGVQLDINVASADSPDHRGFAGAFVADERLYVLVFAAQDPEYYNKHVKTAEAVFDSVTIRIRTIKTGGFD